MCTTVEEAEKALKDARDALDREEERDCHRRDGSGAQEARRRVHQETLAKRVAQCEADLQKAKTQSANK